MDIFMYRSPPADNVHAISNQMEHTAVQDIDHSAAEGNHLFDPADSDNFQGNRYHGISGQGARDSEMSKISLPLFQLLNLDRSSIYSLQGDKAAEIGSKIHYVWS